MTRAAARLPCDMTTKTPPGSSPAVLRYAAFTTDPSGGNPAGVVLDAAGLDDEAMLAIAAEVGYSETAFLTPAADSPDSPESPDGSDGSDSPGRHYTARYFSPKAEVPFCGHATVAAAVALAERDGAVTGDGAQAAYVFATRAGSVPVAVSRAEGAVRATLTSVAPHVEEAAADDVAEALRRARLGRRRTGRRPAAAHRLRGRPPPGPRGRDPGTARPPRLRLRAAGGADAAPRPHDRPTGLAGIAVRLPRARPVPGRRRRGGPCDGRGRRGLRRVRP